MHNLIEFESVLSNVMQASSEIDRVDDLWSFISVSSNGLMSLKGSS